MPTQIWHRYNLLRGDPILDEHPSPSDLEAYCSGSAPKALIQEINEHVADCEQCTLAVINSVRDTARKTQQRIISVLFGFSWPS
jgi:hypothetical protein